MSSYLVDTHALLWFLTDDQQLSPQARRTIETPTNVLLVSAATMWEIAIKKQLGKLQASDELPALIRAQGFDEFAITTDHAWRVATLSQSAHKDPFDRMLAAQALAEQLPIISSDSQLDQYEVTRHW